MSLIDWSDPETMLGLLAEYVADERLDEEADEERASFLGRLSSALTGLASRAEGMSTRATIDRLRGILDAQPVEYRDDPALVHLADCIGELERIAAERPADEGPLQRDGA